MLRWPLAGAAQTGATDGEWPFYGAPIAYMQEGRQFIVAAIGDRLYAPELVAFALPD